MSTTVTRTRFSTAALLICLSIICSCRRSPPISDYPPFIDLPYDDRIRGVPVILVGRILGTFPVGTPRPSKWDDTVSVQMYRVQLAVENVLAGDIRSKEVPVFYFVRAGAWDGPPRLGSWQPGERKMFFLQINSGVLRTICDNFEHCVLSVFTGSHVGWKAPLYNSIAEHILDLLLSKGQGCTDEQLIKAISHTPSFDINNTAAIRKVEQTALMERGAVRKQACQTLADLGDSYFGLPPDPSHTSSLKAACGSTLPDKPPYPLQRRLHGS